MKKTLVLLILIGSSCLGVAQQAPVPLGAWMPVTVKWLHAPPDVAPNLETTSTTVLYFQPNGTAIKIGCVVNHQPGSFTISAGDGQILSEGNWKDEQGKIVVRSQVIMRTVERIDEKLPGPWNREIFTVRDGQLVLRGVRYRRVPQLEKSALEMVPRPAPTTP